MIMKNHILRFALGVLVFVSASNCFALEADKVFPDTTIAFFSISSAERLDQQWQQTQMGVLMKQPEMIAFWKDMRQQISSQISSRTALTFEDFRIVPSGEVSGGMIAPVGQRPGFVLLMDITGRLSEAATLLKNLDQKLVVDRKAIKSTISIRGENASVFTFPATEDDPIERHLVYMLSGNYFIVSDQSAFVALISQRLKGERNDPLAEEPGYDAVMRRCAQDLGEGESTPVIRWFINPLKFGEAVRARIRLPEKRRMQTSVFKTLGEVGFDAVLGIGGTVDLKANEMESLHRTYIHAPGPRKAAMKMFSFPNHDDFTPPSWMPNDIAAGTNMYFDPLTAFDNFGPLFDAVVMRGDKGAWDSILEGFKTDPNWVQIDLREELVKHLGQGAVIFSSYHDPITTDSENLLVAIEIAEGKIPEIQKALEKLLGADPEFELREMDGYLLWMAKPREDVIRPGDADGLGGLLPDLPGAKKPEPKPNPRRNVRGNANPNAFFDEPEGEPFFPKGVITVAHGHLVLCNRGDYLIEILNRTPGSVPPLSDSEDCKQVLKCIESTEMGKKPHFIQSFSRTSEVVRPTYEIIRQGRMPKSKSVLGRVLNIILTPPEMEEGERPAKIDGSKMPEFDTIRKYFGPAGVYGVEEKDGWFIKGFTLKSM